MVKHDKDLIKSIDENKTGLSTTEISAFLQYFRFKCSKHRTTAPLILNDQLIFKVNSTVIKHFIWNR